MLFQKEDNSSNICCHVGYMRFDSTNGKKYIEPLALDDSGTETKKVLR